MEKTNPVLILTKCVLHRYEASVSAVALLKEVALLSLHRTPSRASPPTLAQPDLALHLPVMTAASCEWRAGQVAFAFSALSWSLQTA